MNGADRDAGGDDDIELANEAIDWKSCKLRTGDRVGVLVTSSGAPWIYQNGERVTKGPSTIPLSGQLYALVDLLGSTRGVRYVTNPKPPQYFDCRLVQSAEVSEDGQSARHMTASTDELAGVVYCGSPIALFPDGAYFEVRIDEVRDDAPDGLVIGATLSPPDANQELPAVGDSVPNSWSIGYDGQACVCGSCSDDVEMTEVAWCGRDLTVGDRVGFFVSRGGEAWVVENDVPAAKLAGVVPAGKALYPFVDLLGNTVAVSIVRGACPPLAFRSEGGESTAGGANDANSSHETQTRGLIKARKTCSGFMESLVSEFVTLSEDRLEATHVDATGEQLSGVVFGDAPLQRFANGGAYFEVRLDSALANEDGLAIGVCVRLPREEDDLPPVADTVPGSWTFGYDGCMCVVQPEPEPEKSFKQTRARFRSRDSLYIVTRLTRSEHGYLYHP